MPNSAFLTAFFRQLVGCLLFAIVGGALAAPPYPVTVERSVRGLTAVDIFISNQGLIPVNVVIELTASSNTGFSPNMIGSKFPHYIAPGERKLITTAVPLKKGKPSQFAYRYKYAYGNSGSVHDTTATYRLPFQDDAFGVLRPYTGLPYNDHQLDSSNAVEFLLPPGTPVVAARDGIVLSVRSSAAEEQSSPSHIGNFVTIMHVDGTWSNYGWLLDDSLSVKPGDTVLAGDPLAKSYRNPASHESYLHFSVNRNFFGLQLKSVAIKFKAQGEVFDIYSRAGPVSQTVKPRYPVQSLRDEPWNPPESLIPRTPLPVNYDDEGLSPAQRQANYRQRLVDRANAGGNDTVSGSKPLIALAFAGVILGSFGFFASSVSSSSNRPSGIRGALWSLLRGSPSGSHTQLGDSPMLDFDPHSLAAASDARAGLGAPLLPPQKSADHLLPDRLEPTLDLTSTDNDLLGSSSPHDLPLPAETSGQSADPVPTAPRRVVLMSDTKLSFLALLRGNLPPGLLCTSGVPESALTQADSVDFNNRIDFVLLSASSGEVHAVVLFNDTKEAQLSNLGVAARLSESGIDSITFDKLPSASELSTRLARLSTPTS